jgi:poly(A) polymerase
LRAFRFAAELGFSIDPATEEIINRQCQLINVVAGERIQEELCHLLSAKKASQYLRYLDRVGLLLEIFPELASAKGFEQPKEHFWDVLQHSLSTVEALEFILRDGSWEYVKGDLLEFTPWSDKLAGYFNEEVGGGHQRRVLLKLTALLHDVAKPQTRTIEENGRIRFLGHGKQGASLATEILKRLRFSSREIKLVETVIEHHLRPGQMRNEGLPTRRAMYRFFRDTSEAAVDTLFISLADHLASRGPTLDVEQWKEHNLLISYVLEERERESNLIRPPKLISGNDLISAFHLQPGPELGRILESVREAQAAGEVTNQEEALSLARKLLTH